MTILPASPFISATAETLPSEPPGKDHCSDGSLLSEPNPPEAIDCIGEIFAGARKLNDPEARFVLDVERFMAEIDEPPLFLRRA